MTKKCNCMDHWGEDERTEKLKSELETAREIIKILSDWQIPEDSEESDGRLPSTPLVH